MELLELLMMCAAIIIIGAVIDHFVFKNTSKFPRFTTLGLVVSGILLIIMYVVEYT